MHSLQGAMTMRDNLDIQIQKAGDLQCENNSLNAKIATLEAQLEEAKAEREQDECECENLGSQCCACEDDE